MITRNEVLEHIKNQYGAEPDYPWVRSPNYAILRHKGSRKWFAAVIDITEDKFGLPSKKPIDSMLLKCDPLMIGSLRAEQGFFPAYHMNKEHWISVHLELIDRQELFGLIDLSYQLTKK
ncbi:MAG: MmcQ/YjbR family DNA-binding protein [Clostridia bacterium]|nr:MmcQ/YjbR family DNA-binding protein [Clostridia bacterium]